MEKTCQTCKQIFTTNRSKRRFCSCKCAQRFRYQDRFRICKECLKDFRLTSHNIENIYCSKECYFKTKSKILVVKICETCKKSFKIENWKETTRNFCSKNCLYNRESIVKYRNTAFKQLPNKCAICINQRGRLEVHHIDFDRSNNDISNLSIICHACHLRIHALIKRSGLDPKECMEIMLKTDLFKLDPYRFRALWTHAKKGKILISIKMDLTSYLA